MPPDPAQSAARAADQLQNWLDQYGSRSTPSAERALAVEPTEAQRSPTATFSLEARPNPAAARVSPQRFVPAHTDWLYHHLTVTGPAEKVGAFGKAAAGAGVIPWTLDLDRIEEDFFLRMVAPPSGHRRTLSLEGARMLAAELREAVGRRHALAKSRVGRSRACPFDLHALVPVPAEILRLGPDHRDALLWLWTHWGTTQALRHVVGRPSSVVGGEAFRVSFWAADWTPWRALQKIRADWPGLRFGVRPIYEPM